MSSHSLDPGGACSDVVDRGGGGEGGVETGSCFARLSSCLSAKPRAQVDVFVAHGKRDGVHCTGSLGCV